MYMRITKGFTIIEMVIVITIVGVIAAIGFISFARPQDQFDLQNAESILSSDIRRVITWAQSGKTCCNDTLPEGYGIVFTQNSAVYRVFADNGDHAFTAADTVVETVNANSEAFPDVLIRTCKPANASNECALVADVPGALLHTNGARTENLSLELIHERTNETDEVTVNIISGQIN